MELKKLLNKINYIEIRNLNTNLTINHTYTKLFVNLL